jgi:hypothetical protein
MAQHANVLIVRVAVLVLLAAFTPAWSQTVQPSASSQATTAPQAAKTPAASLGVFVYPRNNQPQAVQQKDEGECYGWARQQTGIDPAAPPENASTQNKKVPPGGAVKGAAGGAAGGAAIGAIAGDTGEGAAVGATVGAMRGRRAQKKAEKQAEQQAKANTQAAQKSRMDTFRNAFSACMDARQYSVK